MAQISAISVAPGLRHSQYDNGVVEADVLDASLSEPSLGLRYLYPGTVATKSVISAQARRTGAIAGVNGDFFRAGPLGVGIDESTMLNGPASGWNDTIAISRGTAGSTGRVDRIVLTASVTLPGGGKLTPGYLNSPELAPGGLGIFTPKWGTTARSVTVAGATRVREVEVRDGVVAAVRDAAGSAPVPAGGVVLLGREGGADSLAALRTGDRVTVSYGPGYTGDAVKVAVGGNLVLLRDGKVTTVEHPRHPRTAVGLSADGKRMWVVALDGRSAASRGMTYVEMGNFMKSLGADDAINLDGGGSTTMVARMPGDSEAGVQNVPSDGSERPVPNGLGFVSAAYPPACVRATLSFASYPALQEGASGREVTAAQCLLKNAGADPASGDPTGTFDAATAEAVRKFQGDRGLPVTGTVSARTWTGLLAAGTTPTLRNGGTGLAVARLQRSLTAALGRTVGADGVFGDLTDQAVRDYQRSRGLAVDGVVGSRTWAALQAGK